MARASRREGAPLRPVSTPILVAFLCAALLPAGCSPEPAESPDATARVPAQAQAPEPSLQNGPHSAILNGFRIHYEIHGSGPILMTLPNSWGLTLQGLRALYRPLEKHLTLVYFDPRGMGGSDPVKEEADMGLAAVRADFVALAEHLGLDRVQAIGWSNGAVNLILLASEKPELFSRIVLLHGMARFQEEDFQAFAPAHQRLFQKWAEMQVKMEAEGFTERASTKYVRRFYLQRFFPASFADPEEARSILPDLYADTRFSYSHSAYSSKEMPTFDFRDRLPLISAPSLVIAGAHDMSPPEKAREIHLGIPDSRFIVFHDSGHFSPVEEPEAFQATVLGFLGADRP